MAHRKRKNSREEKEKVKVRSGREVITHATVNVPIRGDPESVSKLVRLMYAFRDAVRMALPHIRAGRSISETKMIVRGKVNNVWYAYSASCFAKLIFEGLEEEKTWVKILKPFLVSSGDRSRKGNRNIRIEDINTLLVLYPFDGRGKFLKFSMNVPEKFHPVIEDLIREARAGNATYGVSISLKENGLVAHINAPLGIWLRYRKKKEKPLGGNIGAIDLNSDRLNLVIISPDGEILWRKTYWYSEVNSPGFPKGKAWALRLSALREAVSHAWMLGCSTIVFEDLFEIKKRRFTSSKRGNRKISRFPKRKLLMHGILETLEWGMEPVLVDPRFSSLKGKEFGRELGWDEHSGSALALAVRFLYTTGRKCKFCQENRNLLC